MKARAATLSPGTPKFERSGGGRRIGWGFVGLLLGLYLFGYTGGSATTGDRFLAAGCLWLSVLAGRRVLRALGVGRTAASTARAQRGADGFVSQCLPVRPGSSPSLRAIFDALPPYAKQLLARQADAPRA